MAEIPNSKDADNTHVCPPGLVWTFDNFLRPLVHNPKRMFGPYLKEGMVALDIGCGRDFASMGLAELVGENGRVISADLQADMLAMVKQRAEKKNLSARIKLHQCQADRLGMEENVDFAVCFFMLHEVPSQHALLEEVYAQLNSGGHFFIAEPLVHVTKKEFQKSLDLAEQIGFKVAARPKIFFSHTAILEKA